MSHNLLSVKAIENIILLLVDASAEIKSARPYGEFKLNTKRTDQYPVLFYDFQQSDLNINNKKYTRDIVMAIGVAEQVWEGRVNEIDMKSRCEGMLQTFLIKLMESSEFSDIGVRFVDKTISMQNLDVTGDDRTIGVFAHVKFSMNLPICEADLPFLPLGTETNTYEPSDPQSLFCSYISSCPVIAEMQEDIALLFTLTGSTGGAQTFVQEGVNIYTGGTPSAPTVNVVASPVFVSMSAGTIWSGSSELGSLLPRVYLQDGTNTVTGGTATEPKVHVVDYPQFIGLTASTSITAANFISGATNLNQIFAPIGAVGGSTFVQNGTNTTTGGTAVLPTVNLVATPSVTGLIASGTVTGSTVQGNTINHYGETINGGVYFQTNNTLDIAANLTYNNSSSILSVRNGVTSPTGGFTGNSYFCGATDFNHILTSSVSNYFTQSSVTLNGNVTITSGLTVSGSTIFLGGVDLDSLGSKSPVLWLTAPQRQISGSSEFNYIYSTSTLSVTNVRAAEFIGAGYPERGVIFHDPSADVLTGDSISFYYYSPSTTLWCDVYSGGTMHTGKLLASDDLHYYPAPSASVIYTTTNDSILSGSSLFRWSEVLSQLQVTNLKATILVEAPTLSGTTIYEGATTLPNKYAPKDLTITQTSATYILGLSDDSRMVNMSGASAQNLVVPRNAAVALPIGSQVSIFQSGAGQVSFSADTGVTLQSYTNKLKITGQYGGASLVKTDTNIWALFGNLSA